ncbi:MAG: hypothetical protein WD872_06180 [Pirellulaceae bacterium]
MQRRFTRFVESPSRENYLAVRDAVLRLTPLPIQATDLAELVRMLDAGQFQEVLDRIELLPPSKVLSPRVHFLAAEAAEELGDANAGELERFLFVLCLKGLLATGDGSRGAPYSVCHATDEHDVLEANGYEAAGQTLVEHDGRACDLITCSDGRQFWFDVSALLSRPKRPARRSRRATTRKRRVPLS